MTNGNALHPKWDVIGWNLSQFNLHYVTKFAPQRIDTIFNRNSSGTISDVTKYRIMLNAPLLVNAKKKIRPNRTYSGYVGVALNLVLGLKSYKVD